MKDKITKISKFLSYVLRHNPEAIGIELCEGGWVKVDILLAAANNHGQCIDRELLDEVVRTNNKKRFSFSADGAEIRANQGHSIRSVELGLAAQTPPQVLYHGTVNKFVSSIKVAGIQKMNRQHVHLSAAKETAICVGSRRGKPVVLIVQALKMHSEGHAFFLSENGVWLTDFVPNEYVNYLSS